jgi:hypothetical protein
LKSRDEFSGYSWDYFMAEKSSTTSILRRQFQWIKATGIRVKPSDVTMKITDGTFEGHVLGKWSFG